jgi:hypothetical protein
LYRNFIVLVKLKEFSKSKQLAEEFEDYQALIEICDELKDTEQLRMYIEQFGDKVKIFFSFESKIKI